MQIALLVLSFLAAKPSGLTEETVRPRWRVKVGPAAGALALAPAGERLVVLTWDGDVVGLESATGTERWRVKAPRDRVDGPWLGGSAGVAVVGREDDAHLVGYGVGDGASRWERDLGAPVTGVAACPGYRLVAATHRAAGTLRIHAIDPADGSTLWLEPAEGAVLGAASGHVFVGVRSGLGRLLSRIDAYRCADGTRVAVTGTESRYAEWRGADRGRALVHHFNQPGGQGSLCVVPLDGGGPTCLAPGDRSPAKLPLGAAALVGDRLYFAVGRIEARNLNPNPDAWLVGWDLAANAPLGHSPHSVASLDPVPAGEALLWTGFGSTGAEDHLFLVDAVTLKPVRTLNLKKAPGALAVDTKRAYAGTYAGHVLAVDLPLPGPAPQPERPVTPRAGAAVKVGAPDLFGFRLERVVDAHPKRGRTSGMNVEGAVGALAFLEGGRLAAGGNDDRVRLFELATGREVARTKALGKDIVELVGCAGGGVRAKNYDGRLFHFDTKGRPTKACQPIEPDGPAWSERCTAAECVLETGGRTLRFDVRGGVWAPSVRSHVAIAPDGSLLVFHRDGLETLLVDLRTERRTSLGVVRRAMSAVPKVAFSPDGRRFAVTMKPDPHQVSVYGLAPK